MRGADSSLLLLLVFFWFSLGPFWGFSLGFISLHLASRNSTDQVTPLFLLLLSPSRFNHFASESREGGGKYNFRSFFNSRVHLLSFPPSLWLIPNFLSRFIELWYSQIVRSFGGFIWERAIMPVWHSAAMLIGYWPLVPIPIIIAGCSRVTLPTPLIVQTLQLA